MCENDCIDREPLGYISDDCAALLCERHTGRGYIYPYASPEHNTPLCLDSDRAWLQGQLLDTRAECQRLAARVEWLEAHEEDWRTQHLEDTKKIEALEGKAGRRSGMSEAGSIGDVDALETP